MKPPPVRCGYHHPHAAAGSRHAPARGTSVHRMRPDGRRCHRLGDATGRAAVGIRGDRGSGPCDCCRRLVGGPGSGPRTPCGCLLRFRPVRIRFLQTCTAEGGPDEICTTETCTGEICTTEIGSTEIPPGQTGAERRGTAGRHAADVGLLPLALLERGPGPADLRGSGRHTGTDTGDDSDDPADASGSTAARTCRVEFAGHRPGSGATGTDHASPHHGRRPTGDHHDRPGRRLTRLDRGGRRLTPRTRAEPVAGMRAPHARQRAGPVPPGRSGGAPGSPTGRGR